MKTQRLIYVLFIGILLCMNSFISAQTRMMPIPFDSLTQKYTYTAVVTNNLSQFEAYNNARNWFLGMHTSRTKTNKSNEGFSGRSMMTVLFPVNAGIIRWVEVVDLEFSVHLEFKDKRYRYTITDIVITRVSDEPNFDMTLEKFVEANSRRKSSGEIKIRKAMITVADRLHEHFQEFIEKMDAGVNGNLKKPEEDW